MGSAQSYVSSELVGTALTGLVIAGAVGVGFTRLCTPSSHIKNDEDTITPAADPPIKKGKKKKQQNKGPAAGETTSGPTSIEQLTAAAVDSSQTIPGQFNLISRHHVITQDSSAAENAIPKPKKPKKKKNKTSSEDATKGLSIPSEYHSESSSVQIVHDSRNIRRPLPQPQTTPGVGMSSSRTLHIATTSLDTDSSWTQVGSKNSRQSSALRPSAGSQSEASLTTSQKDESSPRNAEDDSHDSFLLQQTTLPSSSWGSQNQKTIDEKSLQNPQKTGVEDLLEAPDYQSPPRVIRVKPLPNEKPVAGFSWGDYEDVRVATDGGENDADGEDDGWGVVTSKRPRRPLSMASSSLQPLKAPESLTKKQRQNAQKREQQKAAKVEAETQRLTALAGHKRELEKVRIEELFGPGKARSSKTSGGMKATVDERGKLIWE